MPLNELPEVIEWMLGMVRFDSLIPSRKALNELTKAIEWVMGMVRCDSLFLSRNANQRTAIEWAVCWPVGIEMAVGFDSRALTRKLLNRLAEAIEWVVCWLVGIEMVMSCTD